MKKHIQRIRTIDCRTRLEWAKARVEKAEAVAQLAKARTEQAEARVAQAKSRAELAETRTEQAETRIESSKTRTEQAESRTERAETRAEQVESALHEEMKNNAVVPQKVSLRLYNHQPLKRISTATTSLAQLTGRQREILQLIAEGQNTKQIGGALKISSKTVEYHRIKLMDSLHVHEVAGLVRFAMRAGLLPSES